MGVAGAKVSAVGEEPAAYGAVMEVFDLINKDVVVRPSGTKAPGARKCGQADLLDELRARVSSWPPLRLAWLRRERKSKGVVSPTAPVRTERTREMRRVIGIDTHRTFGEVVIWDGRRIFTRHRYIAPPASGCSSLTSLWGFPCCVRSPCVCCRHSLGAAAGRRPRSSHPAVGSTTVWARGPS